MSNPWSIAFDSQWNLYVADGGNNRVLKIRAQARTGREKRAGHGGGKGVALMGGWHFSNPAWLLLALPSVPWILWLAWSSDVQISPWRRAVSLVLRLVVVTALILAGRRITAFKAGGRDERVLFAGSFAECARRGAGTGTAICQHLGCGKKPAGPGRGGGVRGGCRHRVLAERGGEPGESAGGGGHGRDGHRGGGPAGDGGVSGNGAEAVGAALGRQRKYGGGGGGGAFGAVAGGDAGCIAVGNGESG